jgi:hypothetical protein
MTLRPAFRLDLGCPHKAERLHLSMLGTWMFRHKRSEPPMSVPFETGWAKTRFA